MTIQRYIDPEKVIIYEAFKCEETLQLADFADRNADFPLGMANALRQLAAINSKNAFHWARQLKKS